MIGTFALPLGNRERRDQGQFEILRWSPFRVNDRQIATGGSLIICAASGGRLSERESNSARVERE
jgi:hypothetical protein